MPDPIPNGINKARRRTEFIYQDFGALHLSFTLVLPTKTNEINIIRTNMNQSSRSYYEWIRYRPNNINIYQSMPPETLKHIPWSYYLSKGFV